MIITKHLLLRAGALALLAVVSVAALSCGDNNDEPNFRAKGQPVDLGLGVKWADVNVGAPAASGFGGLYGWSEPTGSTTDMTGITVTFNGDLTSCQWESEEYGGKRPLDNISHSDNDIATESWGSHWRIPTRAEWQELLSRCTITATTLNGVGGVQVTGPNGNSIFLPAGGHRERTSTYSSGTLGDYWCATLVTNQSAYGITSNVNCAAWALEFNANDGSTQFVPQLRCYGLSVRPVYVE